MLIFPKRQRTLLLSRYGRLGASSRLRMLQYYPYLQSTGIQITQSPFFDDNYLLRFYSGQRTRFSFFTAFLRRFRWLNAVRNFDLIWVEKEVLPWVPWFIERAFFSSRIPIVTDYDDAVFHNYDLHHSPLVRYLLGRKIDKFMRASSLVTVGNAYLADRARRAGARCVEIIPTVVNSDKYVPRPVQYGRNILRIGWIGSPTTWKNYLLPIMPMLTDIASGERARITAVGAETPTAAQYPFLDILPWSEETEVRRIQEMDIGIMPLIDTPWARGKCGYKLIQYMACALPVVASPVGVNADIVEHGVNGFLVTTQAQWREALVTLLRDADLRQRMGAAGRQKVEAQYSLQVWGPRVAAMLKEVVEKG